MPGSHRVIDISSCPVHPRPVNQVSRYLKGKLLELRIVALRRAKRQRSAALFRFSLQFRAPRAECYLGDAAIVNFPRGWRWLVPCSRKFSFITGVIQNINEQRGNVIWGDRYHLLSGRDSLLEQVGGLKFGFPAGVFSQANPSTAKKLYDMVAEMAALSGRENVVDLYCGVGPISIYLAGAARLVWGIDDGALSIDTAKQNARRNGIGNCRFVEGDVGEKLAEAQKTLGKIDRIVLNPPRKGVQPAAMDAILAVKAPKIIYVSCEPTSLARDLDKLVTQGYRIVRLQPLDMFPQTEQVENVVLLGEGLEAGFRCQVSGFR